MVCFYFKNMHHTNQPTLFLLLVTSLEWLLVWWFKAATSCYKLVGTTTKFSKSTNVRRRKNVVVSDAFPLKHAWMDVRSRIPVVQWSDLFRRWAEMLIAFVFESCISKVTCADVSLLLLSLTAVWLTDWRLDSYHSQRSAELDPDDKLKGSKSTHFPLSSYISARI